MGKHKRKTILIKKENKEHIKPDVKPPSTVYNKSSAVPVRPFNYSVDDILNRPVYIVNNDPKRWEFMQYELKRNGFKNPVRFPAIDGHKYQNSDNMYRLSAALGIEFRGKPELRSNWAASLSQIFLYYQALKDDVDYIYIMEDDSLFCDDFKNKFEKYLDNTPPDFDILYIGSQPDFNRGCKKIHSFNLSQYVASVPSFCLHNYIITKQGIIKYLNEIKKLKYSSLDCDLINWCQQEKFKHYQFILNDNDKFGRNVYKPRSYGLVAQTQDFSIPEPEPEPVPVAVNTESESDLIHCNCGSTIQRKGFLRHLKTRKHLNNI